MEAADVLYGVTMKLGGSSKVVSEKVEGRRLSESVIDLSDSDAPAPATAAGPGPRPPGRPHGRPGQDSS